MIGIYSQQGTPSPFRSTGIALERTVVGVSGSSNLAHMFAESRGGIHIHSANFARLPLAEPDEPMPTADEHNNTVHVSSP